MTAMMRAIRVHRFGGPEELACEEVPIPRPGRGEVLVRIHAAGVNPPDWYARTGYVGIPEPLRPTRVPMPFTPGSDLSGVVVDAGPEAGDLRVGDEVYGLVRFPAIGDAGGRCYAEYTTAPTAHLARKPASVDHVAAAGMPMAGLTAYQRLFDHVRLQPDQTVLVNGAAGGVGHFVVQLAKTRHARVIGVASGRHERFLRQLGVDQFIDYTRTAPEDAVRGVDLVVDTVGGPDGYRFLSVLRRGGTLAPVFLGEYHAEDAARAGIAIRRAQVHPDGAQLADLARLIDDGRLRVGIDNVYSLADASKAHARAAQGHLEGKIILEAAGT